MKFLLLLCLPVTLAAQTVTADSLLRLPPELDRATLLTRLTEFMAVPEEDSLMALPEDLKTFYGAIMAVQRMPQFPPGSFAWRMLNVVPLNDSCYECQLSYLGITPAGAAADPLRVRLIATRRPTGIGLELPFRYDTRKWHVTRLGDIDFHHRTVFDTAAAGRMVAHSERLADLLDIAPLSIQYYKFRDIQEVYASLGIAYSIRLNGYARSAYTDRANRLFLSGTDSEYYGHDLTHYYFAAAIPDSVRNWTAEEGYNINLTSYWGEPAATVYGMLGNYLADNPGRSPGDILSDNDLLRFPIRGRMPVAAVLMRRVEREFGAEGVLELVRSGRTLEDFTAGARRLLATDDLDAVVLAELEYPSAAQGSSDD